MCYVGGGQQWWRSLSSESDSEGICPGPQCLLAQLSGMGQTGRNKTAGNIKIARRCLAPHWAAAVDGCYLVSRGLEVRLLSSRSGRSWAGPRGEAVISTAEIADGSGLL